MSWDLERQFAEPIAPPSSRFGHDQFKAAFEEIYPELQGVKDEQLLHINVDMEASVTTTLTCEPNVHSFHEVIEQLPQFKTQHVKKLKQYAQTLWYVLGLYEQATNPGTTIQDLGAQLITTRTRLVVDSEALVAHGILDKGFLDELSGETGYANSTSDICTLALKLRLNYPKFRDRTALTLHEIDEALALAEKMAFAIGAKEHANLTVRAIVQLRPRLHPVHDRPRPGTPGALLSSGRRRHGQDPAPSLPAERPEEGSRDASCRPSGGTNPAGGTASPTTGTRGAAGTTTAPAPAGTPVAPAIGTPAPAAGSVATSPTLPAATAPTLTVASSVNNGSLSVQTSAEPGMPGQTRSSAPDPTCSNDHFLRQARSGDPHLHPPRSNE